MTALTWQRHELPPWERQRGYMATYAMQIPHPTPGAEQWIVIERARLKANRQLVWIAIWYPAGCRGPHVHLASHLFGARTLKACRLLVELWAGTSPWKEATA